MKKTSLIILLIFSLLLSACSSPTDSSTTASQTTMTTTATPTTATPTTTTAAPTTTAPTTIATTTVPTTTATTAMITLPSGSISVSSNAQTVRLTVPASLISFGNLSKADIEKSAKENGVSEVIFNQDGSATYVMSHQTYQKMLDEMKKSIDTSIAEMLADKNTSFKSITYNPSMTEFIVKVDAARYKEIETMSALVFYMTGAMYQTFTGVSPNNIKVVVKFVDNATGKVLYTGDSAKIGK